MTLWSQSKSAFLLSIFLLGFKPSYWSIIIRTLIALNFGLSCASQGATRFALLHHYCWNRITDIDLVALITILEYAQEETFYCVTLGMSYQI